MNSWLSRTPLQEPALSEHVHLSQVHSSPDPFTSLNQTPATSRALLPTLASPSYHTPTTVMRPQSAVVQAGRSALGGGGAQGTPVCDTAHHQRARAAALPGGVGVQVDESRTPTPSYQSVKLKPACAVQRAMTNAMLNCIPEQSNK